VAVEEEDLEVDLQAEEAHHREVVVDHPAAAGYL